MAYDLAYDGWDEEFRKKVAGALAGYDEGKFMSLGELARGSRHGPHSNHWGCQIGGAALALLAIRGDPGADDGKLKPLLEANATCIVRQVTEGFGDGGYSNEHAGPGQIASDTAYLPAVQAWRVAGGKDFVGPRPHVSNVTLIRVYELLARKGGGVQYPLRHPSSYGTQDFGRDGLSRGGQFVQGLGAVKPEFRPAVQWTYENVVEPDPAKRTYDLVSPYPHRAILALANWPIGETAKNPADVLPRVLHDSLKHYAVFRNRWKDADDILVTGLWGARNDGKEPVLVWGLGERIEWGSCPKQKESKLSGVKPDGSGVITAGPCSLAVDFSKASGADALLVMTGPGAGDGPPPKSGKARAESVVAGSTTYHVLTLSAGVHPEPKADGDALVVGGQRVTLAGGALTLAK
jgi:hypothetical protein